MPRRQRPMWNAATIQAEIRRLHDRGSSLAWARAPVSLRKAAESHLGSWAAAVRSVGIEYDDVRLTQRYTDESLLTWLRDTAAASPELTLAEVRRDVRFMRLKDRFGSWRAAVERAGLTDWPRLSGRLQWTKPAVIAALRDLYGRGLTANRDTKVYTAATRLFGSLERAAAEAGIELQLGRSWSRREVVALLRRLAREHGKISSAVVIEARCRTAIVKHFGGIKAACDALGLPADHVELARAYAAQEDRDGLLDQLAAVARPLERPVVAVDLPSSLLHSLIRQFGSIEDARAAAGLPQPAPHAKWDRARALAELREEHRRGTRLTERGLIAAGRKDLVHAIASYVGRISAARRIARVPEPEPLPRRRRAFHKEWDEDRVLAEIRDLNASGLSLAPTKVPAPLLSAASRYLGSWREALAAAGLDYNAVVLHRAFEDGELLSRLRQLASEHPAMTLAELNEQPISTSLHRHYGSPEEAARAAGLDGWPARAHYPRMSRAEIRRALRARVTDGKSLDRVHVVADEPRMVYAIQTIIHPDWEEAMVRLRLRRSRRRQPGIVP